MKRCVALVALLMKIPAAKDDLMQIYFNEQSDLPADDADKRFENDRTRLKENFGCIIEYNRQARTYSITDMGIFQPILDASGADQIRTCGHCNRNFIPRNPDHYPPQRYCDDVCKQRAENRRYYARHTDKARRRAAQTMRQLRARKANK